MATLARTLTPPLSSAARTDTAGTPAVGSVAGHHGGTDSRRRSASAAGAQQTPVVVPPALQLPIAILVTTGQAGAVAGVHKPYKVVSTLEQAQAFA